MSTDFVAGPSSNPMAQGEFAGRVLAGATAGPRARAAALQDVETRCSMTRALVAGAAKGGAMRHRAVGH
jgi:hypothetical protein